MGNFIYVAGLKCEVFIWSFHHYKVIIKKWLAIASTILINDTAQKAHAQYYS